MTPSVRFTMVVNSATTVSETFLRSKLAGLTRYGFQVTVLEVAPQRGAPWPQELCDVRRASLRSSLPRGGGSLVRNMIRAPVRKDARHRVAVAAYATAVTATSPDLVNFAFSGLAVTFLDSFPLLGSVPLTMSCRGEAEQIKALVVPERREELRRVFDHMAAIHCVSDDMRHTVERLGAPGERIFVNRPAIDASHFRRSRPYEATQGARRLMSVGRLHWKKGFDDGLAAVRHLVRAGHDVEYLVLGEGPERERLTYLVDRWGLADRVTLTGSRPPDEVRRLMESSDVFVLPSLSEGLSNAALEAMAMELPVVTTAAGGMAEAVDDGKSGLLVPERDPHALAEAIAILLDDFERRRSLGQGARQRVEGSFTLDRQTAVFAARYRELAGVRA